MINEPIKIQDSRPMAGLTVTGLQQAVARRRRESCIDEAKRKSRSGDVVAT